LVEVLRRELACVLEQEGHISISKNSIASKSILLWDSDDFSQHVTQPGRVDEIQVVETSKVVIVVQENAVVVKELCRCEEEKKEKEKVTVASGTMDLLRGEFNSSE